MDYRNCYIYELFPNINLVFVLISLCVLDSIVKGMQLERASSKTSHGFTSIIKDASFSRGWLHFAVQCFFAIITVTSFILIIIMSTPNDSQHEPVPPRVSRCHATYCMIYCDDVPNFGKHIEDIAYAVSQLPDTCAGFQLTLHKPMFRNETLSPYWLPRTRIPIHELSIIEGNLKHFPPEVFLNQNLANIRTLFLSGLVIKTLTVNSFVGLSKLLRFYIKSSTIVNIQANVLRSVDDTLESLTILHSEHWDPINITGTGTTNLLHLTTVDFSHNYFSDILNKNSFSDLMRCKTLYLNSCKITAIGEGTFDHLLNIDMLFLNNNLLLTIPPTLFAKMMLLHAPKPRINLQDNLWYCGCHVAVIKELVSNDMLLIDPTCVSPTKYNGKTFSELITYCNDNTKDLDNEGSNEIFSEDATPTFHGFVYINNGCHDGNENASFNYMRILSPLHGHGCSSTKLYREAFNMPAIIKKDYKGTISQSTWISFMFFLKSENYSMLQIATTQKNDFGLLWYQSSCPNEVYCVNVASTELKIYNVDIDADYVFCPVQLISGTLESEKCVHHNMANFDHMYFKQQLQLFLFICVGGICLVIGAICVYGLIRKNPNLLRGSKRILFVKHKNVDALVLPPKVPLRNDLIHDIQAEVNEKNVFTIPIASIKFNRMKSTRSSKSNAPSYISALQPTEDQLAEWRINNHFNNDLTICSADFFSSMDILDKDKTYDSLK